VSHRTAASSSPARRGGLATDRAVGRNRRPAQSVAPEIGGT